MTKFAWLKVLFPLFDPIDPLILKPGGAPKMECKQIHFINCCSFFSWYHLQFLLHAFMPTVITGLFHEKQLFFPFSTFPAIDNNINSIWMNNWININACCPCCQEVPDPEKKTDRMAGSNGSRWSCEIWSCAVWAWRAHYSLLIINCSLPLFLDI